jgi:hypothetical protein
MVGPTLSARARLWPLFRRVERQSRLFGEMIERVDLDSATAVREEMGAGFASAAQRCLTCRNSLACEEWLQTSAVGRAPAFCPNAAFLNRLRRAPAVDTA